MKQSFSDFLKNNPLYYLVMLFIVAGWIVVFFNWGQSWLVLLVSLMTVAAGWGLIRNLNGKDGLL